jgi:hypothetical protein
MKIPDMRCVTLRFSEAMPGGLHGPLQQVHSFLRNSF